MLNREPARALSAEEMKCAASALRWAAFGSTHRGPALKYKQSSFCNSFIRWVKP